MKEKQKKNKETAKKKRISEKEKTKRQGNGQTDLRGRRTNKHN